MMERLNSDMINAMKNQDKVTLNVIRMVKGAIQLDEISKGRKLEDDEIVAIVSKQIKIRKESMVEFEKGHRQDLTDQAIIEIDILNQYLPEQLGDEELESIISEIIIKLDAKLPSDMGKVMKELTPLVKGKADMSKVSTIIKDKLSVN